MQTKINRTRVIAFVVIFALSVIAISSINVSALTDATSGFTYELINEIGEKVTITGYNGAAKDIVIPDTIDNRQVAAIEDIAFSVNQDLTSVTIPRNVNNIGNMSIGFYYNVDRDVFQKLANFRIRCYTGSSAEQYAVENGINYEIIDERPAVVTGFKASSTTLSSISLTWNAVPYAQGYIIYNYDIDNNKWVRVVKTSNLSTNCLLNNLTPGRTYKLAIKAYKTVDNREISSANYPVIVASTNPSTVTGFKVAATSTRAIKLTWNKVAGARGYIVYQAKNGKWSRVIKTETATNAYVVQNLNNGSEYRFAVKAYKTINNKEISSPKYPTVYGYTKLPTVSGFKASSVTDSTVKLTWNKLSGANGYNIYRYNASNNKWVRIAKTTNTSNIFTVSNLKSETAYKFAVRGYKTIKGKELGSINYPTINVKTKKETVKIQKINGITYLNGVLIANKTYGLPASYNPGGLTSETYNAFLRMQSGAAKSNISLWITSGFRSYSYQASLYNSYVARDGQYAADRYSARPGYSEHQTGLALDLNNASAWFNNSKEAAWIEKHCAEYGFILRYPRGKESKTGYQYESWHVRYVGVDLAKKVMSSGLCLEEYFGITSRYN